MTTWRKVGCCLATVAGVLFTASADIYRATAEGAGTKDGSSWGNAMAWTDALTSCAALEGENEIWLAGDVTVSALSTVTVKGDLTVRGGFTGTETSPAERPANAISTISGNNAVIDIIQPTVDADKTLAFERVALVRGSYRAVKKAGAGNISFTDCELSGNGRTIGHNKSDVEGLGLYASGGGSATLTRCKLEGNGPTDYIQEGPGGFAIRASALSRLTIDDCVFLTNGLWKASKTDADLRAHRGIAIYLTNTPLTMRNSRVSGSIAEPKGSSVGAIVTLAGNCGGSAFTNCVFSGNLDLNKGGNSTRTGGGIVEIDLGSSDQKVDISGCTFAYNLSQSTDAGCLAVRKGDVHVTDSTFFYNLLGYSNAGGYGADITVFADGKLAIEKSRLDTLTAGSISSVNPENLTIDTATMTTGNPHFKSSVLDYEAIVSFGSGCAVAKTSYDKLVDLDATPLSPAPVKLDIGEGNVLYVDQSATGAKDGSSWADAFTDLGSALAAASSVKNEIWVKGDLKPAADAAWTEINDSVTVRGGFAGTESAATDRAAGAVTTMDGNNNYDFIKVSVVGACTLTFENFVFTKTKYRAIFKRGFGDLVCRNCKFLNCGTNQNADGRGILAQGGSCAAKLVVEACEFAGLKRSGRQPSSGCGTAVNVALHERLICDNSLFCSNGVPILNSGNDNRSVLGSALLIRGTPVTMRNTRIAANGGSSRESDATGGIVYISGYADGSACTNCAFVGNYANNFKDGKNNNSCGAFVYSPCAASHRLDFESCTFAYNMSQGNYSPGGLNVLTGTVKVHNSIFWHNIHGYKAQSGYGADIDVKAGAVTVSHSLVTGKTIEFCHGASDGNLVLDDTVVTVDPSFVSSYEDYASHLNFNGATYIDPGTGFGFAYLGSLDAHLLSVAGYWLNDGSVGPATNVTSLAIDGGDPDSPYGEEPMPNGGCINLGAYGNTQFASKTPSGQPSVESFEITYPDGYSRPQAELTLGLESGTSYKATVTFTCKTGDVVVATEVFENRQSGDVVTWKPPYYFQPGTPLVIEYAVSAPGATTKAGSGDSTASGVLPPFYGKGGGANVIHVREGADCLMNGTDWTDAYPDVPAALQDIGPGKTEIWIARETTFASGTFTLEAPLAIRGGFAGTETSLAERTGMSQTVFDLQDASAGFRFTADADCPLLFDRVVISRAFDRAITKSGAGSLTLVDCRISNNGHLNVVDGRGIYASGCPVAATNCVFDGNYYGSDGDVTGQGGGAYLTSCPQAIFESCLFTTNGNQYVHPKTTQCGGGGALYAYATRLICRNTRFAANVTGDRSQYAVIRMENNCDGSLFENCAIVGNSLISHWDDNDFNSSSILMVNMNVSSYRLTIRNCTFAYNFNSNRTTPGALNVVMGTVDVADSIFWGNYRGSRIKDDTAYPSAEDIAVEANGYLTLSNVFLKSMDMATDKRHCLQVADLTHLVTNNIVTGDAMLVSTPEDAAALMVKGNENRYLDWYYPKSAISALCALNVHLRGGSGYHDENDNGALVRTYSRGKVGGSSPAIDAGPKMMKGLLEPKPNGNRVNLGAYGNTPWATMSDNTGLLLFVR